MPHDINLILTLTGGLTAALALGFFTHRIGLSPIVGYLVAGVLVGPFTPGFVADKPLADQLAEIGVILLMFGVGLHFHVRDLWQMRKVAVPGAIVQIAVATALGAFVGRVAGWSWGASIVFGLAISVASTVVLTRVLTDGRVLHTPAGHLAMGWLVLEDVFTVLVLVLLPSMAGQSGGGDAVSFALAVGIALLKLGGLVAFTLVVGQRALPVVLRFVARTGSRELFTLTVLVIALGIAVGSAILFGASMALGAFLAGMVVGQSEFSSRAASEALPMRDAFAVLFFVSVGMLLNPAELARTWHIAAGTLAVVLIGKPLTAVAVVLLLRLPMKTAITVGLALGQIGEFSFILAAVARQLGMFPQAAADALVVTSIVSITLNPVLFGRRDLFARWLSRIARRRAEGAAPPPPSEDKQLPEGEIAHRAIVVGYGPVGRTLSRLLRENGIEPTIIELNIDTVRALSAEGARAIYGDATQQEILVEAGIRTARSLLFTASGVPAEDVIRSAKELNPKLFILARAGYLREVAALKRAGADLVVASEGEVALAMTEHLLTRLGATSEQIERERGRVREGIQKTEPA